MKLFCKENECQSESRKRGQIIIMQTIYTTKTVVLMGKDLRRNMWISSIVREGAMRNFGRKALTSNKMKERIFGCAENQGLFFVTYIWIQHGQNKLKRHFDIRRSSCKIFSEARGIEGKPATYVQLCAG